MAPRVSLTTDYETTDWNDAKVALTRDLQQLMFAINKLIGATFSDENILLPEAFDSDGSVTFELTGDVEGGPSLSPLATTITPDSVGFSKLQNISTQTIIGRTTAGTGDPQSVSTSDVLDWLGT